MARTALFTIGKSSGQSSSGLQVLIGIGYQGVFIALESGWNGTWRSTTGSTDCFGQTRRQQRFAR
jgi:hypothetical protein